MWLGKAELFPKADKPTMKYMFSLFLNGVHIWNWQEIYNSMTSWAISRIQKCPDWYILIMQTHRYPWISPKCYSLSVWLLISKSWSVTPPRNCICYSAVFQLRVKNRDRKVVLQSRIPVPPKHLGMGKFHKIQNKGLLGKAQLFSKNWVTEHKTSFSCSWMVALSKIK